MPFLPFAPPDDTKEKDRRWQAFAKVGFRDSRRLWTDYWQRFNTITIPLLDEDAYFADACAAANVAQDREHLEALLSEKAKERRAEFERVVNKLSLGVTFDMDLSSPTTALDAADKIGRAGSLDSFLRLASGVVWGWGDEGQLGERRPRAERSPFNFTDAQEPSHSPHPQVSDAAPSPTTPPDLPSEREAGPPKPAPLGRRSSPQREGGQEAGGGSSGAAAEQPGWKADAKEEEAA